MNRIFVASLVICWLALATPAWAHAPIMGIGGVFGGLLHALLIPEHGMSLVALGLVLGRLERPKRRMGILIFTAAVTCGLAATTFLHDTTFAADVLVLTMGLLGLLTAVSFGPPLLAWPLAAVAGVALALDSRPEVTETDEVIRMLIGSGLGAVIALAIVTEGSVFLKGNLARIAMRVLGSWIAAGAILVLALRIAPRSATG